MNINLLLLSLVSIWAVVACSKVPLIKEIPVQLASLESPLFSTGKPTALSTATRILFIVDKSGSNVSGNNGAGTDPDKKFRGESMMKFFQKFKGTKGLEWGLITFQEGNIANRVPKNADGSEKFFTGDDAEFQTAYDSFFNDGDVNGTPYRGATTKGLEAIQNSRQKDKNLSAQYHVFFFSDGYPTDAGTKAEWKDQILPLVDSMVDLTGGRTTFSTVYYGPQDPDAEGLLLEMAQRGKGLYSNATVSTDIDVQEMLENLASKEPVVIREMVVYNLSHIPCFSGIMGVDSDADGLCDEDELALNEIAKNPSHASYKDFKTKMNGQFFKIDNSNSFTDDYKDIFMWIRLRGGSIPPVCGKAEGLKDEDFDFINVCEENFLLNTTMNGPSADWSDAMKELGGYGNPQNFDTDGDGILDYLELVHFKSRSAFGSYNQSLEQTNGHINKELFMEHVAPITPDFTKKYGPVLKLKSSGSDGQNYYKFDVDQIPLVETKEVKKGEFAHASNENLVLIYAIVVPESAPNSRGELRKLIQKVPFGTKNVKLDLKNKDLFQDSDLVGLKK